MTYTKSLGLQNVINIFVNNQQIYYIITISLNEINQNVVQMPSTSNN